MVHVDEKASTCTCMHNTKSTLDNTYTYNSDYAGINYLYRPSNGDIFHNSLRVLPTTCFQTRSCQGTPGRPRGASCRCGGLGL